MRVTTDRSDEAPVPGPLNRRRRRAYDCLADALRFQLEACRESEGLAAIVVSDELGFCVAHSGGDGEHAELAARLPILANAPAVPDAPESQTPLSATADGPLLVRSFSIGDETLYVGAVVTPGDDGLGVVGGLAALDRVASGFARLLAQ